MSAAAAAPHRARVLSLYGAILRAAKHFPSVKRDSIVRSIKEEFRANARLDPSDAKVSKCLAVAERGRHDLENYKRAALQGGTGDDGAAGQQQELTIALKGAAHHHPSGPVPGES
jgi:hypothetical protein